MLPFAIHNRKTAVQAISIVKKTNTTEGLADFDQLEEINQQK